MSVIRDLQRWGPADSSAPRVSLEEARAYCRRLARSHYENFTVASWLLPRSLRQHFANVYAYCRWSDDLADETGDRGESLRLLDWWEGQLQAAYSGDCWHPVFVALSDTIREFEIPQQPFADLISAFRQDQEKTRYETVEEQLDYCRRSANPVGRIVLYLGQSNRGDTRPTADSVCTGLQLANFLQDVAADWRRGRVYVPREICRRFGYDEGMFAAGVYNQSFRTMMASETARAEELLLAGRSLPRRLPRWLRLDVGLFVDGGLAALAAIRRVDYNVWLGRPRVSKARKTGLLLKRLLGFGGQGD